MSDIEESIESPLTVLSATDAQDLANVVIARLQVRDALIRVSNEVGAGISFANNDIRNVWGSSGLSVFLSVVIDGHEATGETQNISAVGLVGLADEVQDLAIHHKNATPDRLELGPVASFIDPPIYFESTVSAAIPEKQGDLIRAAASLAEKAAVIGAGDLDAMSRSTLVIATNGFRGYTRKTYGEFSMLARTSSGTASGWSWYGAEDFSKVNVQEIAGRAIEIAQRSENPVAVEPGRYTVIIEPEAVAPFVDAMVDFPVAFMDAELADSGRTVFSNKGGGNKLGQKLTDERVQLSYDPNDPLAPFSPLHRDGWILQRTFWIENGILKNLAYSPGYARRQQRKVIFNPRLARLEISGKPQTLNEMIASTKRGIWVHRIGALAPLDGRTLQVSGVTRDGTFLIENGRVTKPVKNMRFVASPFFLLNRLETAGVPVRAALSYVCPRLKVQEFEFASLIDAI